MQKNVFKTEKPMMVGTFFCNLSKQINLGRAPEKFSKKK
jgi:hypothetical protein